MSLIERFAAKQKAEQVAREKLTEKGKIYFGDKPVEVKKITIAQWKELFALVETLPALIVDVLSASEEDKVAYIVVAAERSFDEITKIVSVLTDIDADYIENNAGLDDILEFFVQTAEVNDFSKIAKNINRVLALSFKGMLNGSANQSQATEEKA